MRILIATILSSIVLCFAGCGGDKSPTAPSAPVTPPAPPAPTLTAVTVQGPDCVNEGVCDVPGATLQLGATARYSDGTSTSVTSTATWTSTASAVATVSSAGLVTTRTTGTTDVLATYQGKFGGVTVRVPAPWTRSGTGDTVFDMPTYVARVRITGDYRAYSSNFIVHIAGRGVVNELLGTGWGMTYFEGIYVTTGGLVEILHSSGVSWSFTQVRQ